MTHVQERPVFTVVLGIADPHQASIMRREIDRHPRFDVIRDAPNAVLTLDSAATLQPDLVILSDLSPGVQGREILGDLEQDAPKANVIVTIAGDPTVIGNAANVTHTVHDHDPEAMRTALDSTAEALDHPAEQTERRVQRDRRLLQDWTQVFSERRVTVRRASDLEPGHIDLPYIN